MPPTYNASLAFTLARHAATSSPTTTATIGMTSKAAGAAPRALKPACSHSRNIVMRRTEKNVGIQPSAISAERATFLGPTAAR
jgi:hypothetical protein